MWLQPPRDGAPTLAMLGEQTCKETRVQAWGVTFVNRYLLQGRDESTD